MGRRLIINADDLGYDPAVTEGILLAMRTGVVTSATFMVNTPFSEEAAAASRGLSLGLHFNLARGRALSQTFPAALLGPDGFEEARAGALPAEAVEQEALAQIHRFEELLGAKPTHIDVHKHLHLQPGVLDGLCRAAARRELPVRSIDGAMREEIRARGVKTNPHFIGDAGKEAYWTFERFEEQLRLLPDGVTELMCHPGYAPSTLESGYAAQREVELSTFTDPRAKALLAREGVELIDFRAL